jgi:type IV pilus assembly protein PilQ
MAKTTIGVSRLLCCIAALFVAALVFGGPSSAQTWSDSTAQSGGERAGSAGGGAAGVIPLFDVNNAEVRSVFNLLAAFSGVDIVPDDGVSGTVTLKVTNKSWREILQIVCKVLNLVPIKESGYIYVMNTTDYRAQQLTNAQSMQLAESTDPLRREIVKLSNVAADEMSKSVTSLLSTRGKITVSEHNNALIIFDTKENINQIASVIQQLDVETQQISISCKMIQVSSGDLQDMGIHWGFFDADAGVNVEHLPATNFVSGALEKLSYGILSPQRFSVALEYLFSDNRGEIVAQPQITTVDNKEARIFMGDQVPVKYLDEARNTVIRMVEAGTELTVTPHVSGDNRVMLDLFPKKKSYVMQNDVPVVSEQSAKTNVSVNDGETVVIAGLTSNEDIKTSSGIPVLKDIPIIGHLFKRSNKTKNKKDLIIFVTPHIVARQLDAAHVASKPAGQQ